MTPVMGAFPLQIRENKSGPEGAGNTVRGLTHLLDHPERQAAVEATPRTEQITVTRRDGTKHTIIFDQADADVVLAHTWCVMPGSSGVLYAITARQRPDGRSGWVSMHRLLMGVPGIDHINHDGLDNRRVNLRRVNQRQNGANERPRRGGTSAYKGVSWDRAARRWRAQIQDGSRKRNLGRFDSEEAAARAYDHAALTMRGEYACINFPEPPENKEQTA